MKNNRMSLFNNSFEKIFDIPNTTHTLYFIYLYLIYILYSIMINTPIKNK